MSESRSTPQRLGDITLVLVAVAALTLVATVWSAADHADGHASTFWSYVGLSVNAFLVPSFAAACAYNWIDEERRRLARACVLVLLALSAAAALGEAIFGGSQFNGDRGANFMQDAAALLMVAGGATLVIGLVVQRVDE